MTFAIVVLDIISENIELVVRMRKYMAKDVSINNDCKGWINCTCNNVILCRHMKKLQDSYIMIILIKKNTIKKEYNIEKKRTKDADCKEFGNATCESLKICRCNRVNYFNTTRERNVFQNVTPTM